MLNYKKIYFLGIGGIGMSGLARYFKYMGCIVAGYDKTTTTLTKELEKEGISVHYEENIDSIVKDADLYCYTPAIPVDSIEFRYLKDNGYELKKRSQVLEELTKDKFTIAIAGTHGKTSITSLLSHIFEFSGKPVTAFIGGISKNGNSNVIINENKDAFLIVEADEYDRSFLNLNPSIALISAIDEDHLDIYGNKERLQEAFKSFANNVDKNGCLFIKKQYDFPVDIEKSTYSLNDNSDYYTENIRINKHLYLFDISGRKSIKDIELNVPGRHNIENALAAAVIALKCGIEENKIKEAIKNWKGVVRRFDYRIKNENFVYIDDYAHHPQELKAFINAVRELYPDKKISGIFQPHLFTRTRDFVDEFAEALSLLDELILLDIYPARELPIEGITSKIVFDKVKIKNKILTQKDNVIEIISKKKDLEVLLTIGAGDIDTLIVHLEKLLN